MQLFACKELFFDPSPSSYLLMAWGRADANTFFDIGPNSYHGTLVSATRTCNTSRACATTRPHTAFE